MEGKELKKRIIFLEDHIWSYQEDLDWYASVVSLEEEYKNKKLEKSIEIDFKKKEIEKIKKELEKERGWLFFISNGPNYDSLLQQLALSKLQLKNMKEELSNLKWSIERRYERIEQHKDQMEKSLKKWKQELLDIKNKKL